MTIPFFDPEDIVLGTTVPILPIPQFRLSPTDQAYHATIWGRTGSGKSKLLQSVFLQHLNKGHGVGLVEPHHDLSFDTLSYLVSHGFFQDDEAYERLVYLDWGNGDFVPFNILSTDFEPHVAANNALEAMIRVWPELASAPMFQNLFLSSLVTLIANKLPITYLHALLTDPAFRKACLLKVDDPIVHQSFDHFDRLGKDQATLAGSTLRRAFLLSFSPVARNTLGQPDNWLPFRKWMDEGKSFIINLGNINDHETRKLIGAMVLVQIEQAALSRTNIAPADRTPCTLLVDEWPSFAAQDDTIGTILSQTRKFNLRLYLAAQSLSQISSKRLSGALENCRLTVAFGLGRESAEAQAKYIGKADPFALKEEALTQTQHAQYLSIMEQFETWTEELQNLPPRTAYVKLHDQDAARIRTLTVPDDEVDQGELKEVLAEYKHRYQRSPQQTKEAIEKITAPLAAPPRTTSRPSDAEPAYKNLFRRPTKTEDDSDLPN